MSNPKCFFDVSIGDETIGRIIFELFTQICPKTSENFLKLCTGSCGVGLTSGKRLCYEGSTFHRIVPGLLLQGGDITKRDGTGGESIYGGTFADENFSLLHDRPYLLSMANKGMNSNGSQFFITFKEASYLNGKHVVFGVVVAGHSVLHQIEKTPLNPQTHIPATPVMISRCGEVTLSPKESPLIAPTINEHQDQSGSTRRRKKDGEYLEDGEMSSTSSSGSPLMPSRAHRRSSSPEYSHRPHYRHAKHSRDSSSPETTRYTRPNDWYRSAPTRPDNHWRGNRFYRSYDGRGRGYNRNPSFRNNHEGMSTFPAPQRAPCNSNLANHKSVFFGSHLQSFPNHCNNLQEAPPELVQVPPGGQAPWHGRAPFGPPLMGMTLLTANPVCPPSNFTTTPQEIETSACDLISNVPQHSAAGAIPSSPTDESVGSSPHQQQQIHDVHPPPAADSQNIVSNCPQPEPSISTLQQPPVLVLPGNPVPGHPDGMEEQQDDYSSDTSRSARNDEGVSSQKSPAGPSVELLCSSQNDSNSSSTSSSSDSSSSHSEDETSASSTASPRLKSPSAEEACSADSEEVDDYAHVEEDPMHGSQEKAVKALSPSSGPRSHSNSRISSSQSRASSSSRSPSSPAQRRVERLTHNRHYQPTTARPSQEVSSPGTQHRNAFRHREDCRRQRHGVPGPAEIQLESSTSGSHSYSEDYLGRGRRDSSYYSYHRRNQRGAHFNNHVSRSTTRALSSSSMTSSSYSRSSGSRSSSSSSSSRSVISSNSSSVNSSSTYSSTRRNNVPRHTRKSRNGKS